MRHPGPNVKVIKLSFPVILHAFKLPLVNDIMNVFFFSWCVCITHKSVTPCLLNFCLIICFFFCMTTTCYTPLRHDLSLSLSRFESFDTGDSLYTSERSNKHLLTVNVTISTTTSMVEFSNKVRMFFVVVVFFFTPMCISYSGVFRCASQS